MRLFIALPLSELVEKELGRIIALLRLQGGRVTWVAPKNIHMTVRFLGETDEVRVPKLKAIIDKAAESSQAEDVVIDRLGGFPHLTKPRVIWAGLKASEAVERLEKMARQVELAVRQLRFEPESRGFKPHLTLGRVKDPQGLQQLTSYIGAFRMEPIKVRVDELVLFKSTLTPQGSIYERIHEAKLGDERMEG